MPLINNGCNMVDKNHSASGVPNDQSTIGRRKALKLGGLSLASVGGFTKLSKAKSESADPYDRSLELRKRLNWTNEEWRDYLDRVGIPHGNQELTVQRPYPVSSTEDVSTTSFDQNECTIYMTYTRPDYAGYDVVDLEWAHHIDDIYTDNGASPMDNALITWETKYYDATSSRDDWVYMGDHCSQPSDVDAEKPGGAVIDHDDTEITTNKSHGGYGSYFGVYLDHNWEDYNENERALWFDFVHTWSGSGLDSVSVSGTGSLSLGFSSNTSMWRVEDNHTESQLLDGETKTGN